MTRRTAHWLPFAILVLAARLAAEGADHVELWHEYFINGQKVGWSHTAIERAEYEGRPAWWTKSQQELRIKARGVTSVTRTEEEAYATLEFVPLFSKSRREEGEQVSEEEVVVQGGKVRIRKKVNDNVEEKELDLEGKAIHDQSGQYYASLRLEAGKPVADHSIETREMAISDVAILLEERETLALAGSEHDAMRLRIENSLFKNFPMSLWVRDDGFVVQMKAGPLSMKLTTEAEAKGYGEIQELANMMPVKPVLLFPGRFQEVTLSIRLEGGDTQDLIPEGPYHLVTATADTLSVTLLAQPAPPGPSVQRPVTEPSLADFLRSTPRCSGDDPLIREKAQEIVGEEKDALLAVAKIVHWVYRSLKKESSIVGAKTAKETLVEGSGDCTEHAVLVAALCRALGIPARSATGLMWIGKEAGYHQWTEVWVGMWLPVDATLDAIGTPPAYLHFGYADEGALSGETTSRMMRFFGRAKVSVASVRGADGVRVLSEKDDLVEVAADRVEHFGWGISYPRPDGWDHKLLTDSDAAVFQRDRSVMQIRPLLGAAPLSMEGAVELQGTLTGVLSDLKVLSADLAEDGGRRTYRSELTGRTQGVTMRYRLALLQEGGRTFLALFSAKDTPSFADDAKAFEDFLSQLRFP